MPSHLPPLQTLRAFEAAGRLLSMALAAAELNVTPGAVSRQIQTLEEDLGVALFRRMTRRIALTEEGTALHQVVSRALAELTREAERLRSLEATPRLTLSTSVSFASKWFAPRLHRLIARLPDVDIRLEVSDVDVDLTDGRVDAAVRYGTGTYPGTASERILDETMSPVCSPDYRARMGGLTAPADLTHCMLLHEQRVLHDDSTLPNWERWFAAAGVAGLRTRGPTLSHGSLTIEAALRGEGVALGRSVLVAEDIAAGRLIEPFPQIRLPAGRGYDLVHRPGEEDDPRIAALRAWLKEEVETFLAAVKLAPNVHTARAAASGADWVVDAATVYGSTVEAIADLGLVLATTARPREMSKPILNAAAAAMRLADRIDAGERAGILFGAERSGLDNDDVALADAIVTFPTAPEFASLNLAQSVLLTGYEWFRTRDGAGGRPRAELPPLAPKQDLDRLFAHLEDELDAAGFLFPPEKRPVMVRNLRTIFLKAGLTDQEVRSLRGVIRALSEFKQRRT